MRYLPHGGNVPLMSFDRAQDERDLRCALMYVDLRSRYEKENLP